MGNFHNNQLPNNHFRKDWQTRVKTWFNQPGRAQRRHRNRVRKSAKLGAKPLKPLMPAVRCPTIRYNMKVRQGFGFTLTELKAAGIHKREARGLGIKVDHRRRNLSEEGMKVNVDRLKAYKTKLIVFPKRTRNSVYLKKNGDKMDEDKKGKPRFTESSTPYAKLDKGEVTREALPLPAREHEAPRAITKAEKEANAFETLKAAWTWHRETGKRMLEAKKAEEEEAAKKK
ncbi:60S ribosomal protein L13 [Tulasnella sp. 330]|nr:60S ribosomal protein L13 [Tulasnella sp. 330]KAG8881665.1 60S ribosomal protein L13 [Tulasnella sp. 331]KAG8882737.1 60S ribosomal protein L13 [Tulasnella sp. 332]